LIGTVTWTTSVVAASGDPPVLGLPQLATSRRKIDPVNRTPVSAAGVGCLQDRTVSEA
jgi:hypothetical protein